MLSSGQKWELFGYDTRSLGKVWLSAWREFLWSDESPVRKGLDEVVCLHSGEEATLYQSGQPSAPAPFECEAVLLPDDLVLTRQLSVPLAAEHELDAVVGLEISANSPFTPDDTAAGWLVRERDEAHLHLALAIVSRSAAMTYLGRNFDIHDARAREVWAEAYGRKIVLSGFGEGGREARYRKCLQRCGAMILASAMLLLSIAGVAAMAKRAEFSQLESLAQEVDREAAGAAEMRAALALANEGISEADGILAKYPSPHVELARLTRLLGDDAFIVQFTMSGREIRIRGRASDAAAVMEKLTNEEDYIEVTAPAAIVKVAKSDLARRFSL